MPSPRSVATLIQAFTTSSATIFNLLSMVKRPLQVPEGCAVDRCSALINDKGISMPTMLHNASRAMKDTFSLHPFDKTMRPSKRKRDGNDSDRCGPREHCSLNRPVKQRLCCVHRAQQDFPLSIKCWCRTASEVAWNWAATPHPAKRVRPKDFSFTIYMLGRQIATVMTIPSFEI